MLKKIFILLAVVVSLFSLTNLAISQLDRKSQDDLYSQIELYSYTLSTIMSDYVDEQKSKDLIYGSLKGMLATLDPHSQFLDPDEYKELKTETQGKFGGLGIEISIRDGLLTVISPIEDTPAWKAGIKSGDRIVKIDDELTREMTLSDAVKRLRGKPGTDINLVVFRESESKIHEFKITREVISIQDVKDVQVLTDNIGYIRLTEFREDSAQEFRKALDDLKTQKADALIVDLRNNPGGLLNVAIKITEEFLSEGKLIVSTKGRRVAQHTETYSTNRSHVIDWPVVVLINEGSASGSEIFAGALKDNKRAIVVGEKSFGKGSVQSVLPLPDGSGLRLTTSKYFTPSGESIHGKGIEPDIVVKYIDPKKEDDKEKDDKEKNIEKIFENVKTEAPEKIEGEPVLDKKVQEVKDKLLNDNQVQAAINVIKGVRVYKSFNGAAAYAHTQPNSASADEASEPTQP
jgi:carboxyl-terminal processing protease